MDHKARSRRLQRNEQVKAVSSLMGNGGLALMAAAAARGLVEGLDGHSMLWLADGCLLIGTGVMLLTELEAEN